MTRSEIIAQLFSGKNFNDCINKMQPEELREDLKQEVILIVCEMPEEKIIGLHERKQLEFFTVRVIINQAASKTSPFAKKYRSTYSISDFSLGIATDQHSNRTMDRINAVLAVNPIEADTEERLLRESIEDKAMQQIAELYWYNKELVELYLKHGNFRAIQKETGIPFASCYKTIKKSFEEIKQKVGV